MVDIFFDKLYRYPRINECVSIAVPFAKGELYNTDNISIVQNKRKCIIQPKVTAEYDDGSIKYLFVDFMADLPANKSAKAVLTTTKQELANLIADGQSECAKQDGTVSVTPVNNGLPTTAVQYSGSLMITGKYIQIRILKVHILRIKMAMLISLRLESGRLLRPDQLLQA